MKNKLLKIFSVIFVTFLFINNVGAISLVDAKDNLTQEGEYNSTRFVAGNTVNNKATIDGLSFVAGNNVFGLGNLTYGFYAGNIVNINDRVAKDLFVAGNYVTIGSEAVLERDLFIAGNTVTVNADIGRDLRVGADTVILKSITINGDAYIDASKIELDEKTVITGTLSYPEDAEIINIDKASIGNIETKASSDVNLDIATERLESTLFIYGILAAIVTLLIVLSLLPGLREKIEKIKFDGNDYIKTSLFGLLLIIVVPIVCIITVLTILLTPISLITLAIYAMCLYLGPLFVADYVGNLINTKLFKFKKSYLFLSVFLGVLIIKLLGIIPIIGGLIKFLVLIYGLGLIYKFVKTNVKKK